MLKIIPFISLLWLSSLLAASFDELEDINFPLNSSMVVDGFQGLDLLAAVMAKHAHLELEVTGYTDALGTPEYNKKLSLQRAKSVKLYLQKRGIQADRITAKGAGIDPRSSNGDAENKRFKHRHVTLTLLEKHGAIRSKANYRRLIELFFGDTALAKSVNPPIAPSPTSGEGVMEKLSNLSEKHDKFKRSLKDSLKDLKRNQTKIEQELPSRVATHLRLGRYSGISFGLGTDSDGDFNGEFQGLYFRPMSKNAAVQAQGEFRYFDDREEGQIDVAMIAQKGAFKASAAASFKWVSLESMEAARVGQGAFTADWLFQKGKIGLFGTIPFADGDTLATSQVAEESLAWFSEKYISVPTQLGLDLGLDITGKANFTAFVSVVNFEDDPDHTGVPASFLPEQPVRFEDDSDLSGGLKFQYAFRNNAAWYLNFGLNDTRVRDDDDEVVYTTGFKIGSWAHANYGRSDQITPVNIPRIRYEIKTRTVRRGNTAPAVTLSDSLTNAPAGQVEFTATIKDADHDTITYKWRQLSGPPVVLEDFEQPMEDSKQIIATFLGAAGETYSFELEATDSLGGIGRDQIRIAMVAAPLPETAILSFFVSPNAIRAGELANLVWTTEHAKSVSLSGVGEVPLSGNLIVSPQETTTYTLTATNSVNTVTSTVTLTLLPEEPDPPPSIGFFTAAPTAILLGEFTTLSWSTRDAETVLLEGIGEVQASGSVILTPEETTTYRLTATSSVDSVSETVTVTVNTVLPNNAPVANAGPDQSLNFPGVVTLDGSNSFDPDGDPISIQWIQMGGPSVSLSDSNSLMPSFSAERGNTYTFRLIVTDSSGISDSDEVSITVLDF